MSIHTNFQDDDDTPFIIKLTNDRFMEGFLCGLAVSILIACTGCTHNPQSEADAYHGMSKAEVVLWQGEF